MRAHVAGQQGGAGVVVSDGASIALAPSTPEEPGRESHPGGS